MFTIIGATVVLVIVLSLIVESEAINVDEMIDSCETSAAVDAPSAKICQWNSNGKMD